MQGQKTINGAFCTGKNTNQGDLKTKLGQMSPQIKSHFMQMTQEKRLAIDKIFQKRRKIPKHLYVSAHIKNSMH